MIDDSRPYGNICLDDNMICWVGLVKAEDLVRIGLATWLRSGFAAARRYIDVKRVGRGDGFDTNTGIEIWLDIDSLNSIILKVMAVRRGMEAQVGQKSPDERIHAELTHTLDRARWAVKDAEAEKPETFPERQYKEFAAARYDLLQFEQAIGNTFGRYGPGSPRGMGNK